MLHTTVHLAVHNAVMAIEGGYAPYVAKHQAWHNADVRAAVAFFKPRHERNPRDPR